MLKEIGKTDEMIGSLSLSLHGKKRKEYVVGLAPNIGRVWVRTGPAYLHLLLPSLNLWLVGQALAALVIMWLSDLFFKLICMLFFRRKILIRILFGYLVFE